MPLSHSLANEHGIILAIDQSLADLLHRPVREIVGVSYLEITHDRDRVRNYVWVSRLEPGTGAKLLHKRYVRADGEAVWLEVNVSRLAHGIDQGRLIGTFHLPTETKNNMPGRLWHAASHALEGERLRRAAIGSDLMGDFGWIVLLQVYLAEAEGRELEVDRIAALDDIPLSVFMRWLKLFEQRGLVERDGRRNSSYQLSPTGSARAEELLMQQMKLSSSDDD